MSNEEQPNRTYDEYVQLAADAEFCLQVHTYYRNKDDSWSSLVTMAQERAQHYSGTLQTLEEADSKTAEVAETLKGDVSETLTQGVQFIDEAVSAMPDDSPLTEIVKGHKEAVEKVQESLGAAIEALGKASCSEAIKLARGVVGALHTDIDSMQQLGALATEISDRALVDYNRLWPEEVLGQYDTNWRGRLTDLKVKLYRGR